MFFKHTDLTDLTDFCLRHFEHEIFLNTDLTNNTNLRFALLLTVNYKIREICEIRVLKIFVLFVRFVFNNNPCSKKYSCYSRNSCSKKIISGLKILLVV